MENGEKRLLDVAKVGATILCELYELRSRYYYYYVRTHKIDGSVERLHKFNTYGEAHEFYADASREILRMYRIANY